MTLNEKLNHIAHWTPYEANNCWNTYHDKFIAKYGGALHTAMMQGNVGEYIEKELRTFQRYATMWAYRRNLTPRKPLTWTEKDELQHKLGHPLSDEILNDLHHIAQENKLRRLRTGDYFP